MNELDVPILQKSYDLYKQLHSYRRLVPKQDRYTLFERADNTMLEVLSGIFTASNQPKVQKLKTLEEVSNNLNLLRLSVRLMKDIKALDNKKYLNLQSDIEEVGRMLGGWIRSLKE